MGGKEKEDKEVEDVLKIEAELREREEEDFKKVMHGLRAHGRCVGGEEETDDEDDEDEEYTLDSRMMRKQDEGVKECRREEGGERERDTEEEALEGLGWDKEAFFKRSFDDRKKETCEVSLDDKEASEISEVWKPSETSEWNEAELSLMNQRGIYLQREHVNTGTQEEDEEDEEAGRRGGQGGEKGRDGECSQNDELMESMTHSISRLAGLGVTQASQTENGGVREKEGGGPGEEGGARGGAVECKCTLELDVFDLMNAALYDRKRTFDLT